MRLFRVFLVLISAVVLFSCSRPPLELSGIVVYGHEARSIQLCGCSQVFWLETTSQQRQQLVAELQKLPQKPYRQLYMELNGNMAKDSRGEFAKRYDGSIRIVKINRISATISDSCPVMDNFHLCEGED